MTQIPILNGIYVDGSPDFRTRLPRNYVPVPKQQGISAGYLRPSDGLMAFGDGPGIDRGGIEWKGVCYRVMGTKLVSVSSSGTVSTLGDVGSGGQVSLDYSFDRLAIASGGRLYYYNGSSLTQVVDPDLGTVVDFVFIDGYFLTTDGTNLVVTELGDPTQVDPLKYGSSEIDPDPVVGVLELRNEVYAINRYTIEVFDNIGGTGFPFQRIEGAQITRGAIGTHTACIYSEGIAFLGSGRNEPPAIWYGRSGNTTKLSTREIDIILQGYTEAQLEDALIESRSDRSHQHLLIHLPDQTLVYDIAASQELEQPVWFTLDSGTDTPSQYRARDFVWCYDRWIFGDPLQARVGTVTKDNSAHFGSAVGWSFATQIIYNGSRGAIVHDLELAALPGYAATGAAPIIFTSSSDDGVNYTPERGISAGTRGQTQKRIAWRRLGFMRNYRIQQFRGLTDCHLPIARLEAQLEPLSA